MKNIQHNFPEPKELSSNAKSPHVNIKMDHTLLCNAINITDCEPRISVRS